MSDYTTPESDFTGVHRIEPRFPARPVRSTEYGVTINGALVTINGKPIADNEHNVLTFTDYGQACAWAREYEALNPDHGIVGIAHRAIVRQLWAETTREA